MITDNGRAISVGIHEKGVSTDRIVFMTLHAGGCGVFGGIWK